MFIRFNFKETLDYMLSEEKHLNDIKKDARKVIEESLPKIFLEVSAAVVIWFSSKFLISPLIWLFNLEFSTQVANLIVVIILGLVVFKIIFDMRKLFVSIADYVAVELAEPYGVTMNEISHYEQSLKSIFNILLASLLYLMFVDFLSGIHSLISGALLILLSVWSIYAVYSSIESVSDEIRRFTKSWTEMTID